MSAFALPGAPAQNLLGRSVSQFIVRLMAPYEKWDARGTVLRASHCGDGSASWTQPKWKGQDGVALRMGRES